MSVLFETKYLFIEPLSQKDAPFIFELVNTPGWLKFIGDRNVRDLDYALAYIERILSNPNVAYWVVKLKKDLTSIGVITLIKRDYLQHHDLGFAFLPEYSGKGFAFEALSEVIVQLSKLSEHTVFEAITIKDNFASIKLLEKSGFVFNKTIQVEQDELCLYTFQIPLK